jgi:hypothetical protein
MLCEDLLCLAEHRLPTAQGGDKEMWVPQPRIRLQPMFKALLTCSIVNALRWEAIKERCEHHLPLLRAVDAAGKCRRTQQQEASVQLWVRSVWQPPTSQFHWERHAIDRHAPLQAQALMT